MIMALTMEIMPNVLSSVKGEDKRRETTQVISLFLVVSTHIVDILSGFILRTICLPLSPSLLVSFQLRSEPSVYHCLFN